MSACISWLLCLSVSSCWVPAKSQGWTDVPGGDLDKSALVSESRTGCVLLHHLFILSIYREIKAPKVRSSLEESRTESLPGRSPQSMVKEPSVHPERRGEIFNPWQKSPRSSHCKPILQNLEMNHGSSHWDLCPPWTSGSCAHNTG